MTDAADYLRRIVWPRRGLRGWMGFFALYPLSVFFGIGISLRALAYRLGILRGKRSGIPVISVGNLAVGGTGKTPFTLWLARRLARDGFRVAIVLRGYGGKLRGVTIVSDGDGPRFDPEQVGDEAVLLARCFSGVVITAPKRAAGAALAKQLGCDLVLLDDGFQHRGLFRECDLVLVDHRQRTVLPAGPLREHLTALSRASAVLLVDRGDRERHVFKLPVGSPGTELEFAL